MFYTPVQSNRFFDKSLKYSDIDWNSLQNVIGAFESRIRGWYIDPIDILLERKTSKPLRRFGRWLAKREPGGHYVFTVAAMSCVLIDALSQFESGSHYSSNSTFKGFIRAHFNDYSTALQTPIDGYRSDRPTDPPKKLSTIADVLYHGFRCGILHEAHAPLYCGIVPGNVPPTIETIDHAKYGPSATSSVNGNDCPVVILRPEHLFEQVCSWFSTYLRDLRDPTSTHDSLRNKFKDKFKSSFGVDLAGATL